MIKEQHMLYPTIEHLLKGGKYNRYQLCIATAKCARKVAEKQSAAAGSFSDADGRDGRMTKKTPEEKPVRTAINFIDDNIYKIVVPEEK